MNGKQYEIFDNFRKEFRAQIKKWSEFNGELAPLQSKAAEIAGVPPYPVQNPVVYNTALDEITPEDEIKLIVIGDNPGKHEQLSQNCKYLVGQAGKIGEGFFKKNPELGIDFRKNVIILNKTPVHSAKTSQLKFIISNGSSELKKMIFESEIWMAQKTARLHKELLFASDDKFYPELWLVGYAELKGKGLFLNYRDELFKEYFDPAHVATPVPNVAEEILQVASPVPVSDKVFVFQHFSMNRFTIDLKEFQSRQSQPLSLAAALHQLGTLHKNEIFL